MSMSGTGVLGVQVYWSISGEQLLHSHNVIIMSQVLCMTYVKW